MIICNSNNFVVVRPPKTGSTSLVFYFFKSGILDLNKDVYSVDGPFSTWEELETYNKKHGLDYSKLPKPPHGQHQHKNVHCTFDNLRTKGTVQPDMPCVSTIRNPLERVASMLNYIIRIRLPSDPTLRKESIFWDYVKEEGHDFYKKPQCDYFPEHAELFNTENLHEHVSKYILEKGGKVDERIEMRKNPDNKPDVFLAGLTPDRKQSILDTYSKDFELWEKAYAVYN